MELETMVINRNGYEIKVVVSLLEHSFEKKYHASATYTKYKDRVQAMNQDINKEDAIEGAIVRLLSGYPDHIAKML